MENDLSAGISPINSETDHRLAEIAKDFENEFDALAAKYNVNVLAAVSFKEFDQTGVFFAGDKSLIVELGLAKVIENKFSSSNFNQ